MRPQRSGTRVSIGDGRVVVIYDFGSSIGCCGGRDGNTLGSEDVDATLFYLSDAGCVGGTLEREYVGVAGFVVLFCFLRA